MELLDEVLVRLEPRIADLSDHWRAAKPFPHVVIDDFLPTAEADAILSAFPSPEAEPWDATTYVHQRNKLTLERDFAPPIAALFAATADVRFRQAMSVITGIADLLDDPDLVGGGLHQVVRGGFLDVHVDYNLHPASKLHRRLNLLFYLNKEWKSEYHGYLELWDMAQQRAVAKIEPAFNRAVLFETNEISYHGHPAPLQTPPGTTRKSLAVYYYTENSASRAQEHNTLYRQTTGLQGYVKTLMSGTSATVERVRSAGVAATARRALSGAARRLRGLPPENK